MHRAAHRGRRPIIAPRIRARRQHEHRRRPKRDSDDPERVTEQGAMHRPGSMANGLIGIQGHGRDCHVTGLSRDATGRQQASS
jgi:hypothetical protein